MGSTGEPEKKRRHFSSISPTAAAGAAAKKHSLAPCSEEKKLDATVLKYKNQKLCEQLEVLRVECIALNNKFLQLKEKQISYNDTLPLVRKSWEQIVGDLDSLSSCKRELIGSGDVLRNSCPSEDGASCHREDDFINRLLETGATESSGSISPSQIEDLRGTQPTEAHLLQNVVSLVNNMWQVNEHFAACTRDPLNEDESSWKLKMLHDLQSQTVKFLEEMGDLHLKFRLSEDEFHNHQDLNVRNRVDHMRLADEFASTITELEESNNKLAILRAQKDVKLGTNFVLSSFGTKDTNEVRDEQNDLQQLEVSLKELTDLNSSRLARIKKLYEERIGTFKKLADFKNTLMDMKSMSSSKAFLLLNEHIQKSKEELDQWRALVEKLQDEKDNFVWHEKEINLKTDMGDAAHRVVVFSNSRLAELNQILLKLADDRALFETKLEEASREPSRKEIITEFKALLSLLPKSMADMQSELSKHKDASSQLHSLRAEVQSLSNMLNNKENELQSLSDKCSHCDSDIRKLQLKVRDLKQTNQELKLFIEMYRRESTDSSDILEFRDKEYKGWALVHTLKSSLDEHNLELRVKAAIEAEATSQKRLASAEGEIDELRQKLDDSERELSKLSDILKSKHEEGEAYLSEIESIGQAYEDMQTQNQHLLQQIIERDDDNIKLAMEGVKARQMNDLLRLETQTMNKNLQYMNLLVDLYEFKIAKLDEHIKIWSDLTGKLTEDVLRNSAALENGQRRLTGVLDESLQLKKSLDAMQSKCEESRLDVADLLTEIERARFERKRTEEDLEVMTRKAEYLRAQSKSTTVLERLRQEVKEYRGILKCSICLERQKEVVIAKCYHLFCQQCVQKTLEHRQRRCPTCSLCFGPNDVKPIYI